MRPTVAHVIALTLCTLILSLHTRAAVAQEDLCSPPVTGELHASRDLYCIDLTATDRGGTASGVVALEYIPGPFTVPITVDGHYRYAPRITLRGLSRPPAGTRLVAWAATPALDAIERLGVVTNGVNRGGEISLDRFLVLISAETIPLPSEPHGPILLRGESPSNRMRPPDLYQLSLGVVMPPPPAESSRWHGVPMTPNISMLPSEMALTPAAAPWLPRADSPVGEARPPEPRTLRDGDTLELVAGLVHRQIAGHDLLMYGFNGEQPGPLIETTQGARITVRLTNHLDQPTAIHWHGVRLDNRFDGVPGVTQPAVAPGSTFIYTVRFPDAGIYWYHPHQREDVQQDLGLYGNILVRPLGDSLYGLANREAALILDDLLIGDEGPVAYGTDTPTHALMGRFGNVMLVNGAPRWSGRAHRGEVVRFYLTNASNARTWNVSFEGTRTQLVGSDLGPLEHELWTPSVVIGPAERYVVQVRFERSGRFAIVNRVRVLDRLFGRFVPETDTLGIIDVDGERARPDLARSFDSLTVNGTVREEIKRYLRDAGRPPDHELVLAMDAHGLPFLSQRLMMLDSAWFAPVEWGAGMPAMNWATTGKEVRWVLRDPATGRENMDIGWHFHRGDVIKLRIANDRAVLHGMQHPIHLHGQRFLVLAVNGKRNDNLAWKDTVLVPSGAIVDLLVDLSNPGTWMLHCHIAEHLEAGMMTTITVD